jgi:hypothetical protein
MSTWLGPELAAPSSDPYPDHLEQRRPSFTPRPRHEPEASALLAQVLNGLRGIDYTALDAARTSGQRYAAVVAMTPAPSGPKPIQDLLDAMPGYGRLRGLLTRMAATSAERAEPIFRDTCADCHAAVGGWCRHHEAMAEESSQFRQLALALGGAANDHDAWLLTAAAAAAIEGSGR